MKRSRIGRLGEDIAEQYLEKNGYRVIARNYVIARGELDLAAYRRGTVVIAEVKTRAGRSGGRPAAAVDYDKQDRLRNTAAAFMRVQRIGRGEYAATAGSGRDRARVHKRNGRIPVYSRLLRRQRPRPVKRLRFDVIEVYLDGKGGHTVNHIPNAF